MKLHWIEKLNTEIGINVDKSMQMIIEEQLLCEPGCQLKHNRINVSLLELAIDGSIEKMLTNKFDSVVMESRPHSN